MVVANSQSRVRSRARADSERLTPRQLAGELQLAQRQITAVQRSRYGAPIGVAMIIARWLGRSAASYMTELPPRLQVLRFEQ